MADAQNLAYTMYSYFHDVPLKNQNHWRKKNITDEQVTEPQLLGTVKN